MRSGDYLKAVGKAIREARDAVGLSQDQVADKVQISRNMLSGIETGTFNPSVRKLLELTKALKTTPAAVLAEAEEMLL